MKKTIIRVLVGLALGMSMAQARMMTPNDSIHRLQDGEYNSAARPSIGKQWDEFKEKAAEYIAGQFEKFNLKPVGRNEDYFQIIEFTFKFRLID